MGATDKVLAEFFEVTESTINEWKLKHKKFSEALKGGKIQADARVAKALFKRALGYRYQEKTFEDGSLKKVVVKELPPDVGAAMSWLKNRQRETWREKIEIDYNRLSEEDLDYIIKKLKGEHE